MHQVRRLLRSKNFTVAQRAIEQMATLPLDCSIALLDELSAGDSTENKCRAIHFMRLFSCARAESLALQMLDDSDERVRWTCCETLYLIRSSRAVPSLKKTFERRSIRQCSVPMCVCIRRVGR